MQNSGMNTLGYSGNRTFSTGIFGVNTSQGQNSNVPTPLSWQESKMARPIRPKQAIDPLTKKDLTAWTKKDGPYTLKCIAGLEEYRNMDLSIIEIRIFTYMQAMGCFQQAIESGFAAETVKKMKGNQTGQNNTSGQSGNVGGTFGGIFQSKFNRDGIFSSNRNALGQGQGVVNNQNILGQSPNTTTNFLSQPAQNTQNIFAAGPPQNMFATTQNQPFSHSQPNQQQQPYLYNAPQFPHQIRYPPLPVQLSNYLNESVLNQLSDHLLKNYTNQIVASLLARAGITNHILEFLFYMGFNQEQIRQWIIRRILMKQLEDERYRRIEGLLKGQGRDEGRQQNEGRQNEGDFGKYVDFLLARQKYTWQEEVLREGMRKMVRESPFTGDKGYILREMLEIEDKSKQSIREKRGPFDTFREERRQKMREKGQSLWLDDETVDRFQLDKVPIIHRRVSRP